LARPDFRLRLHIHVGDSHSLGPGQVALLEAIAETGSISAAARALGMAYRHAWELVDDLNCCFEGDVVLAAPGGAEGGGTSLTPFGEELVRRFRAMERAATDAIRGDLEALGRKRPRTAKLRR
jgi:molybdate transport system regulatory protein